MIQILKKPIVLLITGIFFIIFYISLDNTSEKRFKSAEIISQLQNEVNETQLIVDEMEKKKIESETDFAKDKIIRDELLKQEDGEIVVMITNLPENEKKEEVAPKLLSPWEEWKIVLMR